MSEFELGIAEFLGEEVLPGTPIEKITSSGSLFDDGIIDSLGLQQLITFIENNYAVTVTEDDLIPDNFDTVSGICELIARLKSA